MPGFNAVGRLAVGQISSTATVALTAQMQVSVRARAAATAQAQIAARLETQTKLSVQPAVNLASALHAQVKLRAPGGVNLASRLTAETKLRVTPGVVIPGLIKAQVKARAPGGVVIPGRLHAVITARVQPAVNLTSHIDARVMARAPGGVVITASIRAQVKALAEKFFVPGSGHSGLPWIPQPAYEVKRAKPFRPIWDRHRAEAIEEAKRKAEAPPPLPPAEIFARHAEVTLRLDEMPDYGKLVRGNWRELEAATREAEDATDAEIVLRAVVETDARDVADAVSAIQQTADLLMQQALEHAAAAPQQRPSEIAMPPRQGAASYHDQLSDLADNADAMRALRENGLMPEEA